MPGTDGPAAPDPAREALVAEVNANILEAAATAQASEALTSPTENTPEQKAEVERLAADVQAQAERLRVVQAESIQASAARMERLRARAARRDELARGR